LDASESMRGCEFRFNPATDSDLMPAAVEDEGDQLADLHLWRLGPGHLGAIVSVVTPAERNEAHFRAKLGKFHTLSHLTIEVRQAA
jgi:Co/Zn/Cd efflux system component